MSNIVLNGNSKKLILNGNQYLGSANSPALVSKTVNQNGTYIAADDNANGYSQVTVNVASTPLDDLLVTQNGTYVPTQGHGFNEVDVNVEPILDDKTITQNGVYSAIDDNLQGYSNVEVNVASTPLDNLSVTENGVYVPTPGHGFNEVEVDVQGGADFSVLTPLVFYYRDTDSGEEGSTPEHNLVLTEQQYYYNHSNHSVGYPNSYTYWDSETKYIKILRDFDAVLQYTLHGYKDSANYAQGALYYNDEQIAFLQALFRRYTSVYIPLSLKVGDTLAIRKPEDYGWSYHELFINHVGEVPE